MSIDSKPRRTDRLELEVESLAQGGRGLARTGDGGFVVFVSGALPGDRVVAEVTKSKRRYAEARCVEILEPAPERVPDVCVHGGEPCPGAPWQGLPYEMQLAEKERQVGEVLSRIGGLESVDVEPILGADTLWRYRNKLEYSFGPSDEGPVLGFHARGRWDLVVEVEDCHLATEAGNRKRNEIRDWARREVLPAYDRRSRQGLLRNLIVREGWRTGELQTRLVTSPGRLPEPPVDLHTVIEGSGSGTSGPTGVLGKEYLREELCGLTFEISPNAFFQTNTEMAERLYGLVAEFAELKGTERVFDLYCGIGSIGLSLARDAGEVWGLELVGEAVLDAGRNAELNGIENARFMEGSSRTGIRPLIEEAGKPDVVILDPPRAGLSQKIVRRVIECDADRIVYVSCNPTSLAPNIAQLAGAGYKLERLKPVDMFPQTPHIECVALLRRDETVSIAPQGEIDG